MHLELLDKQTDQDLFESCSSGDANCAQKMEAAQKDLNSYSNLLPEDDYELYKEKDSIENVLIGIDPNYPKWDTEGMKEFGYSMLSEPEGVLLCMGMTFSACAPIAGLVTTKGVSEIVLDNIENGTDANHYNTAATLTGMFVDKTIIGKIVSTSDVDEVIFSSKFSSQLISSILSELSKGASDEDKEK